ncbi:MAG: HlyD family efflux transporter periplasmic adaptor subunit, partial [Delftia sp.]|nr:HlyD family efflux transporter periplasmic adaptor subunit [Delftia sp.]
EQTLAVLQEGLAPGYARMVEDAERALVGAQSNVAQAQLALAALQEGLAPGYARAVENAQRALDLAAKNLSYARLSAPWPAIVLAVNVAPEATIGPGTPVATLLNVEDGLLFVTYDLGEQHVADVYVGQRALVTLRAFADQPLEGTVESVIPLEGGGATSAHFGVRVQLAPTDLRLMPGLTGRVEIFAGE